MKNRFVYCCLLIIPLLYCTQPAKAAFVIKGNNNHEINYHSGSNNYTTNFADQHYQARTKAPKSKSIAIFLSLPFIFPIGPLGLYHFYLGYDGLGIAHLLLFLFSILILVSPLFDGFFIATLFNSFEYAPIFAALGFLIAYIWAFVDFIRICANDLRPADGGW